MARRHYRRNGGSFGGFTIKKFLIGALAGWLVSSLFGGNMLISGAAGWLVGGGIGGAVGAIIAPRLLSGGLGLTTETASNGWA